MRVCERPTCSQPAEVTYGIDPYELVVCMEAFVEGRSRLAGVLCRRHADSMVVPQGWTLDDRREAAPRLFRSRESAPVPSRKRARRRRAHTSDDTGQLELAVNGSQSNLGNDPDDANEALVEHAMVAAAPKGGEAPPAIEPWQPVFDQSDDLDGLLKARSPLLSRAFGKRGKPGTK
ncbi:MAG: hypothetical protein HY826_14965 [Actinobacteria bacterium]|nr:hypothetical protein [Actinomycetota bacterium]